MGAKLSRSFFTAPEVLFIGFSRRQYPFCEAVREAFMKAGAEVYPVNPNFGEHEAFRVYRSAEEVPAKPEFAYLLTAKGHSAGIVDGLAARGVKRVLFQSRACVDQATLGRCAELGMETAVACPLMALGGGFHRFHGWLSGVRG